MPFAAFPRRIRAARSGLLPLHSPGSSLLRRRPLTALCALLGVLSLNAFVASPAFAGETYSLSPSGSDSNRGTAAAPFRTFAKALSVLRPGDTLEVRGGTYTERLTGPSTRAGSSSQPVVVRAAPGERPVIEGLLWLKGASYWTFDGINVTWSASNKSNEHMVKFGDMSNWRFTNGEVWGAHSYAGILVSGASSGWSIDHSYVHDTYKSNGTNQDHLIYVNTTALGGVIERNVLANSPNGRGVKVGPSSGSTTPIGGVTIRYNTMFNNTGPSNVQLSYGASNNLVYRNLMQRSGSGQMNITGYNLNGSGNRAYENGGWESAGVMSSGSGIADGGGNVMVNPGLASPPTGDFTPTVASALGFGHLAGESTTTTTTAPTTTTTTAPTTTTTTTAPTTTTTTAPTTTTTTAPPTTTPPPSGSSVAFVGASSVGVGATSTRVTVSRPAAVVQGNVMLISLDVRGTPGITPPSGWTLVRGDAIDTVSIKATYVKVAGSAEPASYSFDLSKAKSAVALLVAFSGVSTSAPVAASSGTTSSPASSVLARSVSTLTSNSIVVGFFEMANSSSIDPPAGSVEVAEAGSLSTTTSNVTAEAAYFVQASAGPTGDRAARASSTAANIGHLVALRTT